MLSRSSREFIVDWFWTVPYGSRCSLTLAQEMWLMTKVERYETWPDDVLHRIIHVDTGPNETDSRFMMRLTIRDEDSKLPERHLNLVFQNISEFRKMVRALSCV